MKGIVYIDKRELPPSKKRKTKKNRYYVISEVDGKKRSHGGYDSNGAKEVKRNILKQIADGTFGQVEKADPCFEDYFEEWWSRQKTTLKPGTLIAYQNSFTNYTLPFFVKMKLGDITPEVVQEFIDSIKKKDLSPGYVRTIYGHFRSCINSAANLEIIPKSPCTRRISIPTVSGGSEEYFGPSDIWKIIDGARNPHKTLYAILALSGIRIGECLALRWKNVDFTYGRIQIEQTWELRGMGGLGDPKTETSIRNVEMVSVLSELLRDYQNEHGEINPEAFLFPAPKNPEVPRSYKGVLRAYASTLKTLNLDYHNMHSLRHSFASAAISAGLSIVTVSRSLGHASPAFTLRVYAHEVEETVPRALDIVDTLIREANQGWGEVVNLQSHKDENRGYESSTCKRPFGTLRNYRITEATERKEFKHEARES